MHVTLPSNTAPLLCSGSLFRWFRALRPLLFAAACGPACRPVALENPTCQSCAVVPAGDTTAARAPLASSTASATEASGPKKRPPSTEAATSADSGRSQTTVAEPSVTSLDRPDVLPSLPTVQSNVVQSPRTAQSAASPSDQGVPEGPYPFNQAQPLVNDTAGSPALRYANLSPAACRAEATRRRLPFKRDRRPTPGVATAFRFTGPVAGIQFLSGNWTTPFGVLDCRLALALADMTTLLAKHHVTHVIIGTMYRPNSKMRPGVLSQHGHALAADVIAFKLEDGTTLNVEGDWPPQLGEPSCGRDAQPENPTKNGILLRNLICDIASSRYFHVILTPNYDPPHHDHIHFDIKRGGKRFIIR